MANRQQIWFLVDTRIHAEYAHRASLLPFVTFACCARTVKQNPRICYPERLLFGLCSRADRQRYNLPHMSAESFVDKKDVEHEFIHDSIASGGWVLPPATEGHGADWAGRNYGVQYPREVSPAYPPPLCRSVSNDFLVHLCSTRFVLPHGGSRSSNITRIRCFKQTKRSKIPRVRSYPIIARATSVFLEFWGIATVLCPLISEHYD